MTPATFEALKSRHRISGVLRLQTALRIGAGKAFEAAGTDMPILRDAQDRPYLPGSSIKGSLRSGLESVIRGLGTTRGDPVWACDPFASPCVSDRERKERPKPDQPDLSRLCTACALFGNSDLMGRTFIRDAKRSDSMPAEPVVRDGVGIDRDTGTAREKVKYDFEVVPAGCGFEVEFVLENADELQFSLFLVALQMLHEGEILLGGATTRGLGRVAFDGAPKVERTDAARILTRRGWESLVWADELKAAGDRIRARLDAPKAGADAR